MIAFACPITNGKVYLRCAEPGIKLAAEPDSKVFAYQSATSIFRTYNLFLDLAKKQDDLEALVLLHQDAEIVDPDFCSKVRKALSDSEVALVGCAGALGVRNISWWEGSVTWASFSHRYEEMGGGEIPGLSWDAERAPSYAVTGEVDTLDGFIIAISPWAIENLRFDESLGLLHGYDLDICLQARAAGKKVVTTDFRAIHHHSLDLIGDQDAWVAAHMQIAEKWEGRLGDGGEQDWRLRARRAEAELEAMRVQLRLAEHYITRLAEDFGQLERSKSWRWTTPLRSLFRLARRIRRPGRDPGRVLGDGVVPAAEERGAGEPRLNGAEGGGEGVTAPAAEAPRLPSPPGRA